MLVVLAGTDISKVRKEDAGKALTDTIRKLLDELKVPNGLNALGYKSDCVPIMVAGAMPQVSHVVLKYNRVVCFWCILRKRSKNMCDSFITVHIKKTKLSS